MTDKVEKLLQRLELAQPKIAERDRRYRGIQPLKFTADEVRGDLKTFSVNLCRLAVNSVAERMRVNKIKATVNGQDVSARTTLWWNYSGMDQLLQSVLADALAVGSAYLVVWTDGDERPIITVESAEHVVTEHDPITREVTGAVKRWYERDHLGIVVQEHVVHYEPQAVTHYVRSEAGALEVVGEALDNPLNLVPVVPLINLDRITDAQGYSVLDDMGPLVDALSKLLADMLVASEHVARPKRWATGVELEEATADGFTADEVGEGVLLDAETVKSPFSDAFSMWTTESPEAKFGQLPGADLGGYKTSVELVLQQIMAVTALPAHMVGITTSNPSSAEAIRAAEASLTARAAGRIRVLGIAIQQAIRILVAIDTGSDIDDIAVDLAWADPATKSPAQEADALTKLHSLGIVTTEEARTKMGLDAL